MKYIKLFNENVDEIKNYFNNITDTQNVVYRSGNVVGSRIYKNVIDISLKYKDRNSFDHEDFEESIGYLKDDGFQISENRIYFIFLDIERWPMRSFINKIPSKEDLHKIYWMAYKENGINDFLDEDCKEGCLEVKITIYK